MISINVAMKCYTRRKTDTKSDNETDMNSARCRWCTPSVPA